MPREPLTVGPLSVGYRLTEEALVFGGDTMTATDAAVAAGIVEIGDPGRVAHLPRDLAQAVLAAARERIEDAVDRMKTEAGDLPLIAVGGGAFLVPDRLAGVSRVIRVAAWRMRQRGRRGDRAESAARPTRSIASWAAARRSPRPRRRPPSARSPPAPTAEAVETVDVEDMPLAYLPGNALRVRVRVAGEMRAADDRQNFELRQE